MKFLLLLFLSFLTLKTSAMIETDVWSKDLATNIFADNSFVTLSRDDSEYVDFRTVYLPQAGGRPGVKMDVPSSQLPLSPEQREDTAPEYTIREFVTAPALVRINEQIEASYDKRQDVLRDHAESLNESIADYLAQVWAPSLSGNIIRTSGDARPAFLPSATGSRKRFTEADFLAARGYFSANNIRDVYALVPAFAYNDLLQIEAFLTREKMPNNQALQDGVIGSIYGIRLIERSKGAVYNNANTPAVKAWDATGAANDNACILFWSPQFVRRAKGTATVLYDENSPLLLGSAMNAIMRAGGAKAYPTKQLGVFAVVEAPAS